MLEIYREYQDIICILNINMDATGNQGTAYIRLKHGICTCFLYKRLKYLYFK